MTIDSALYYGVVQEINAVLKAALNRKIDETERLFVFREVQYACAMLAHGETVHRDTLRALPECIAQWEQCLARRKPQQEAAS